MAIDGPALVQAMRDCVGEAGVLDSQAARRAYDCDAYAVEKSAPHVVVLPESTEQVQAVVRWCVRHNVPYTPRGAGTGLSGGALAALGGVLIGTKRLNRVLEIDVPNRALLAQAGLANKRISDAVASHGLHFAPDPSSQTVSTLGGNIGENSGGPHTLKYGVTSRHILGVTLVLPDGELVRYGGRTGIGPGPDPLSVIVGAEGTVGIVTEAWVRLIPVPTSVRTALVAFPTVRAATEAVAAVIGAGIVPAALELMDAGILSALRAAFGLVYPDGAQALLLVECDSDVPVPGGRERTELEMAAVTECCRIHGALEVTVAQDEAERQRLWLARKKGIGAMGRLAPCIVTHDGVIPRSKLPEMLEFVADVAAQKGIGVANLFHAGDGNLHPCFYFDDRDPQQVEAVIEAGESIIQRCLDLGGSISGEHGIGVEKLDLMSRMFSADDLELQARVRSIFNTGSLCNPCKVLPNQKSCVEHRSRWRGAAW